MTHFETLDYIKNSYSARICQLTEEKKAGKKIVGTLCLFVPDEIIFAAGADRVVLCGGKNDTVSIAEQYLPRNICPLVKSSFGSIVNNGCSGVKSCSHFGLVDMVVAENTCDSKKKTYELLGDYVPTYVLDLPQKPDSPAAVKYFLEELNKFKGVMEQLTGNKVTVEQLKKEIVSSNETRKLLHRLYDLRKTDSPPISGVDVIKVLQKQYVLSAEDFKKALRTLIDEAEQVKADKADSKADFTSHAQNNDLRLPDAGREHQSTGDHREQRWYHCRGGKLYGHKVILGPGRREQRSHDCAGRTLYQDTLFLHDSERQAYRQYSGTCKRV